MWFPVGLRFCAKYCLPQAGCFNSYSFDSETKSEPCPCAFADTECEFGYEYNHMGADQDYHTSSLRHSPVTKAAECLGNLFLNWVAAYHALHI